MKFLVIASTLLVLAGHSTGQSYRDDGRCGAGYPAPDGSGDAECNPFDGYHCCSPYNWCGYTADHCDCPTCVDYRDYREDGRCGANYPAPDGSGDAKCNPFEGYPCCSPYNWCGNTAEHCDCTDCDDYRVNWREDGRCGGEYLADTGVMAQCNRDGGYPCCSSYEWCGITAEHCDCPTCIDYREYREDGRCGAGYPAPDGSGDAKCNPVGGYPCCSPSNWCGNTADHCDCSTCVDYREPSYRDDGRCGAGYPAPNGLVNAECNPFDGYPCCSPYNWCGYTAEHCDCSTCVDYRD